MAKPNTHSVWGSRTSFPAGSNAILLQFKKIIAGKQLNGNTADLPVNQKTTSELSRQKQMFPEYDA